MDSVLLFFSSLLYRLDSMTKVNVGVIVLDRTVPEKTGTKSRSFDHSVSNS